MLLKCTHLFIKKKKKIKEFELCGCFEVVDDVSAPCLYGSRESR